MKTLEIRGARENNLKGFDLSIPRDRLVVFTGISGSGKSSLAFDTIYAEGERRYVESLSVHSRSFLKRIARPDVESIDGLSPALSISQRKFNRNPRSTVGTITEVYDYLRLLYARIGEPRCVGCSAALSALSLEEIVCNIMKAPIGTRLAVLSPIAYPSGRGTPANIHGLIDEFRRQGFMRIRVDRVIYDLSGDLPAVDAPLSRGENLELVVDRLVLKEGIRSRVSESVELALKVSGGIVKVIDIDRPGEEQVFTERLFCWACNLVAPTLSPRSFSFNSPDGACSNCSGLGVVLDFDEALIVPNPGLSLREGAILPWAQQGRARHQELLAAFAERSGFSLVTPYENLPDEVRSVLMRGNTTFEGVFAYLKRKMSARERLAKPFAEGDDRSSSNLFTRSIVCSSCRGGRLKSTSLAVFLNDLTIQDIAHLTLDQLAEFLLSLKLSAARSVPAEKIISEAMTRIHFLKDVGLSYLSLDRPAFALSTGEAQRVRLATHLGTALTGVLYVLDEPSVGLHPRDTAQLIRALVRLREAGNSVLVVEHDEAIIRAADYVVEIGPGAGDAGGEVVAAGSVEALLREKKSLTGAYLSGRRSLMPPQVRRTPRGTLGIQGAKVHNLKSLDVSLPLGVLVAVSGVSGSGKSSLVFDTIVPAVTRFLRGDRVASEGVLESLSGAEGIDKVIAIDQNPIGRSPRSNPMSYVEALPLIRELFAGVPESRRRGYTPGRFSVNTKGGRCEACKGEGVTRMAMHFLPDVFVCCEVCGGSRFNEETLTIRYRGETIASVFEMRVARAAEFFSSVPRIAKKINALQSVGLDYLHLGQAANTLSGGEAQRVKMAKALARPVHGHVLYVLDEPTSGLHAEDIRLLANVLQKLVDNGNSAIVVEHHLDLIRFADHVIDLGPEGGPAGGYVVAQGSPEDIAAQEASHTGRALRALLEARDSPKTLTSRSQGEY